MMVDIIFFAVIALYIFFRLHKELGKVDEDEKRNAKEKLAEKISFKSKEISKIQKEITQKIQKAVNKTQEVLEKEEESIKNLSSEAKEEINKILNQANINLDFFLKGAKAAFEMTLKAFSQKDKKNLKFLLSEKIYENFAKSISDREEKSQNLITNIISIEEAEIVNANLKKNIATITVKFTSKQINYVTDQNDNVVDGKKDLISQAVDSWTFKKDLKNENPNWTIIATNYQ
jgi:predicted lipid-binding transport protein (Tim44 family)